MYFDWDGTTSDGLDGYKGSGDLGLSQCASDICFVWFTQIHFDLEGRCKFHTQRIRDGIVLSNGLRACC